MHAKVQNEMRAARCSRGRSLREAFVEELARDAAHASVAGDAVDEREHLVHPRIVSREVDDRRVREPSIGLEPMTPSLP